MAVTTNDHKLRGLKAQKSMVTVLEVGAHNQCLQGLLPLETAGDNLFLASSSLWGLQAPLACDSICTSSSLLNTRV